MDPVTRSSDAILCSSNGKARIETIGLCSSLCNRINRVVSFCIGMIKQGYEATLGRFFGLFWPSRNVKNEEVITIQPSKQVVLNQSLQVLLKSPEEEIPGSSLPPTQGSLEGEVIKTPLDSQSPHVLLGFFNEEFMHSSLPPYQSSLGRKVAKMVLDSQSPQALLFESPEKNILDSSLLPAQSSLGRKVVKTGLGGDMEEHIQNGRTLLANPEATFKQLEWWTEFCRPAELEVSLEMQKICRTMFEKMYPSMMSPSKSPEALVVEPSPLKTVEDEKESDLSEIEALEKSLKEVAEFKEGASFSIKDFNIWMKYLPKYKETNKEAEGAYDWLLRDGMERLVSPYKGPASHVVALKEETDIKENISSGLNASKKHKYDVKKHGVFIGQGLQFKDPSTP